MSENYEQIVTFNIQNQQCSFKSCPEKSNWLAYNISKNENTTLCNDHYEQVQKVMHHALHLRQLQQNDQKL